jgi:hypothetical protein
MNCGVCAAYLRENNPCPGCRAPNKNKPKTRVRCRIKNCGVVRKNKTGLCFDCAGFPCEKLIHLDRRYRAKYHMSMIENLETIRESGLGRFVRKERERWACSFCGGVVCVHRGSCQTCGKNKVWNFRG